MIVIQSHGNNQSLGVCPEASNPHCSLTTMTVELTESVEYKSLPSGLHNVREDLMYAIYALLATVS